MTVWLLRFSAMYDIDTHIELPGVASESGADASEAG